jgi:hypothetical protein
MFNAKEINRRLKSWDLAKALIPMGLDVVDKLTSETKTQILKGHQDLDVAYFDRAATVYARFDVSSYSALEIGFMLDLPCSTILAFIEKYGEDWQTKFRIKGLCEFDRGINTLVSRFGHLSSLYCVSLIYDIKPENTYKAWVDTGAVVYPNRGYQSFMTNGSPIRAKFPFTDPRRETKEEVCKRSICEAA